MLTKIGIAALLGTIGTAAVGGVANAQEPCNTGFVPPPASSVTVVAPSPVVVAPPVANPIVTPVAYGYADGYYGRPGVYYTRQERLRQERLRFEHERAERLRLQRERERAEWMRHHYGNRW
jgi:hypothetical protein